MPRGVYKRKRSLVPTEETKKVTNKVPDRVFLSLINTFAKVTGLSLFESAKLCIKLIEEKDNE